MAVGRGASTHEVDFITSIVRPSDWGAEGGVVGVKIISVASTAGAVAPGPNMASLLVEVLSQLWCN
jgi:hypothetical protein